MKASNRQSTGIEVVEELQQYVDSKTILITGASVKGVGAETALSLARANPAHILLRGGTASKINPVIAEINKLYPANKIVSFKPTCLPSHRSAKLQSLSNLYWIRG